MADNAERYLFFDSTADDIREYQQSDIAEYWRSFLTTGLIHRDGEPLLKVTADGTDRSVTIDLGRALVLGHLYIRDKQSDFPIDDPHPTLDRIDRLVLRYDNNIDDRYIRAFIVKGEESSNPQPPTLTRNEEVYELSLAQIRVVAGKSYVEQSDITDERLVESVCGLASSLVGVPTDVFLQEWNEWFSKQQTEGYVLQSEKGVPGGVIPYDEKARSRGVATLDNSRRVPIEQLWNALVYNRSSNFTGRRSNTKGDNGKYAEIFQLTLYSEDRVIEIPKISYTLSAGNSNTTGYVKVSYQVGSGNEIFFPERYVAGFQDKTYTETINLSTDKRVTIRAYGYEIAGNGSVYCGVENIAYNEFLYIKGAY